MASFVKKQADRDKEMAAMIRPDVPDVSHGMCICLGQYELDKAGLDASKIEVGDVMEMTCKIKVTSVHMEEGCDRIEASIISGDFEDETNEEDDDE